MMFTNRKDKLPVTDTIQLGIRSYFNHIGAFSLFNLLSYLLLFAGVALVVLMFASSAASSGFFASGLLFFLIAGYSMCHIHGAFRAVNTKEPLRVKDFARGWFYLPKNLIVFLVFFIAVFAFYGGVAYFLFGSKMFSFLHSEPTGSLFRDQMNEFGDVVAQSVMKMFVLSLFSIAFGIFTIWMLFGIAMVPFVILSSDKGVLASIAASFRLVKGSRLRLMWINIIGSGFLSVPGVLLVNSEHWSKEHPKLFLAVALGFVFLTVVISPLPLIFQAQAYRFLAETSKQND